MVETTTNNPFTAAYQQVLRAAEDMGFKPLNFNVSDVLGSSELLQAHKKNLDAMSEANRIALVGAQTVAGRHMEIMQQTMIELSEHLRTLATLVSPSEKAAKQSELLKQVFEHATSNTRELAEMIQTTNERAVAVLNQRVAEAMEEVKGLIDSPN